MISDEKMVRFEQIRRRRLEALPRSTDSDDLVWAATCKAWIERDSARILLEFARMVKSGERVPSPLLGWLADAAEASMHKFPENQGNELLIELGLKSRGGRPSATLPPPRLLRMERASAKIRGKPGATVRALAKKYGVSTSVIQHRLHESKASPATVEALLRGLLLVLQHIKL